ncbi:MAG: hypothetical protein NUW06_04105 [Candidatus Acetothermia bacterium]|jgi:hypothetical protein|nr:hypothetical protein [Candidatus Acetothermia bacterium]MDH7505133.1 hypothetical protein [Candidatus Acetothermia bacterium]
MDEKRRRGLYILGLSAAGVALLAAVLTLVAGEFVRERLIQPLLVTFQAIGIYLRAVPQLGIWLFALLLFVLLGSYFLRGLRREPTRREKRAKKVEPRPGLIADLVRRIELGQHGEYFKWRLRRELRDFVVDLLSWREEISTEEALEAIRAGVWTSDPRVREFFQRGFERRYTSLDWLRGLFNSPWGRRDSSFEQDLAFVVGYLESFAAGASAGPRKALAKRGRARWS